MVIKLPDKSCTGCGACMQSCSFKAIKMQARDDGFLYPAINKDKCSQCGQCMRSCHALSKNERHKPISFFAAQVKDKNQLSMSSSGGIFYALASNVIKNNGVVYGCTFDKHYNAILSRADSLADIRAMQGSKYVWSDPSFSYPDVRHNLEDNRWVLYTCLPCQAAGLRKYLNKKYENLFIVDVLCGGAPSPYAFQKYLETLTDEAGKKTLCFQFRDKEKFGAGVNCSYMLNGVKHHENWLENSFYFAFCSKARITWRMSCYSCSYKSISRVSDMTIGDYWGVEKYHKNFKPRDGVSLISINTETGKRLFDLVKNDLITEESDVHYATEKNSLVDEINEGYVKIPKNREAFFYTLHTDGWNKADQKFLGKRKKLLLKQSIGRVIRKLKRMLKN
ncbi:MAG: Coenzyme F420 hydrogenase/dehydrogenase, beta subunit C-terminal domain [Firmicutes bacterium]|nr:Coenzyme F420 hydrogenase/dehydrogenase, beta subunit C-terminal domain [Bacillota bacterium]